MENLLSIGPLELQRAEQWQADFLCSNQYKVSFVNPSQLISTDKFSCFLESRQENTSLYAMYQSSDWSEHLCSTGSAKQLRLAVIYRGRDVVKVLPLLLGNYNLCFGALRRVFFSHNFNILTALGGELLSSLDSELYSSLISRIWSEFPDIDGLYLKGIQTQGPTWQAINGDISKSNLYYSEIGDSELYSVNLPATFESYLSRFKRKKRYNLKRQERLLRKFGQGNLELVCAENPAQVEKFLDDATEVFENSWQKRVSSMLADRALEQVRLMDLAQRGLLRAYVLRCNNRPCAFVLGYQWQGIFHYADVAFDSKLARFSPGSVLLYLMIKDLIERKPASKLNFGIGASEYKRQFATTRCQSNSVLVLRNNLENQMICRFHSVYRKTLAKIRAIF